MKGMLLQWVRVRVYRKQFPEGSLWAQLPRKMALLIELLNGSGAAGEQANNLVILHSNDPVDWQTREILFTGYDWPVREILHGEILFTGYDWPVCEILVRFSSRVMTDHSLR